MNVFLETRPENGITRGNPFPRGTGGSNSFRIPALVTLSDGTLVAAADARWNATFDGGGLDTVVSRSEDQGETWRYRFVNYLGDNGNVYNGGDSTCFIDPALAVTDDDTVYMLVDLYPYGVALNGIGNTAPTGETGFNREGKLLLSGDVHETYGYYLDGNHICDENGRVLSDYRVDGFFNLYQNGELRSNLFFSDSPFKVARTGFLYLTGSSDRGITWWEPKLLNVKRNGELVCLAAPGRGLVTKRGRLIFPVYSYGGSSESQRTSFLYCDEGREWKRSGDFTGASWSSESAAVELPDGSLRFFYRNGTAELCYADYDFDTDSWGGAVGTGIPVNSNCQISAIRYSKTIGGRPVILVSCPAGPGGDGSSVCHASCRLNGRIFVFAVEADLTLRKMGEIAVTDPDAQFMYSCLTELADGRVGILFEDHESRWGVGDDCFYTMRYKTYDLSQIMKPEFDG